MWFLNSYTWRGKPTTVKTHRKLTVLGVVLLAVTFLINHYHQQDSPEHGFNYAYVPGIAMLLVFTLSLFLFNRNRV